MSGNQSMLIKEANSTLLQAVDRVSLRVSEPTVNDRTIQPDANIWALRGIESSDLERLLCTNSTIIAPNLIYPNSVNTIRDQILADKTRFFISSLPTNNTGNLNGLVGGSTNDEAQQSPEERLTGLPTMLSLSSDLKQARQTARQPITSPAVSQAQINAAVAAASQLQPQVSAYMMQPDICSVIQSSAALQPQTPNNTVPNNVLNSSLSSSSFFPNPTNLSFAPPNGQIQHQIGVNPPDPQSMAGLLDFSISPAASSPASFSSNHLQLISPHIPHAFQPLCPLGAYAPQMPTMFDQCSSTANTTTTNSTTTPYSRSSKFAKRKPTTLLNKMIRGGLMNAAATTTTTTIPNNIGSLSPIRAMMPNVAIGEVDSNKNQHSTCSSPLNNLLQQQPISGDASVDLSPLDHMGDDMESTDADDTSGTRLERKRERNRVAARRCRERRLTLIQSLELKVAERDANLRQLKSTMLQYHTEGQRLVDLVMSIADTCPSLKSELHRFPLLFQQPSTPQLPGGFLAATSTNQALVNRVAMSSTGSSVGGGGAALSAIKQEQEQQHQHHLPQQSHPAFLSYTNCRTSFPSTTLLLPSISSTSATNNATTSTATVAHRVLDSNSMLVDPSVCSNVTTSSSCGVLTGLQPIVEASIPI